MARTRVSYVCRSCGAVQARWMGKCPDCGAWDALEEHRVDRSIARDPQRGLAEGWRQGPDADAAIEPPKAVPLSEAGARSTTPARIDTGVAEFDRVLGGGIVPGSAVLLGGDPGIGKSTLLLQVARRLASREVRTLYVSSEESAEQIRLRAERLGGTPSPGAADELFVLADTNLARIVEQVRRVQPRLVVIDSVQMIYKADLDASPGTVAQLRRCCTELTYLAKVSGVAVMLVGHVTKQGSLAGPRLLEHLVDAVLYFEGDRHHALRVVRGVKNRFGTTLEAGLFEMTAGGLVEAPQGVALAAQEEPRPGSVVCPAMAGSRAMLVEVQALTATGFPGSVKRKASGVDSNRLAMLIAVLEQHAGLRLHDRDVFASATGGVRIVEPAADLALALAIAGAHHKRALAPSTAAVGEIGLGGEVRPAPQMEARLREAARLGFKRVIAPPGGAPPVEGVELAPAANIDRAIEELG